MQQYYYIILNGDNMLTTKDFKQATITFEKLKLITQNTADKLEFYSDSQDITPPEK